MLNAFSKAREFVGCAWQLGDGPLAKMSILWRETKNLRTRLGLDRYHPDSVYRLATVYGPLWFRDNFGDITNLPNLMYREVYRTPRPVGDGVILDVGANIGLAAAWFAHRHPGQPIHCFEPLVANARMIALNCPTATVNEVAVGAEPGSIELAVDADSVMASSIATNWHTSLRRVQVLALDDYIARHHIVAVALLKIDTEGMELEVLRGAIATLGLTAQVTMETHEEFRHRDVLDHLRSCGFRIEREEFSGSTGLVFASRPGVGSRPVSATPA